MKLGHWIGLIGLIAVLYVLWQIRQLLLLVFAAVVLSTILNMLARCLQQWGLKRRLSVFVAISLSIVVLLGAFWVIVPPFSSQFQELTELLPRAVDQLEEWLENLKNLNVENIDSYIPDAEALANQIQPLFSELVGRSVDFFSSFLGIALNGLLVLVLTLMLLADPVPYRRAFIRLFPSFYRHRADAILDRCELELRGWLAGVSFNMLIVAIVSWLGLAFLQVKLALAHAVLAGLLTFIPNIGPALSVVPPMAVALLDDPWKSLAVLILYIFIQQVESNFLTPYIMSQQVLLLPAVTLLAQIFFAISFGFIGLLLALPLAVVAQVWLKEALVKDVLDPWQGNPLGSRREEIDTRESAMTREKGDDSSEVGEDANGQAAAIAPGTEP